MSAEFTHIVSMPITEYPFGESGRAFRFRIIRDCIGALSTPATGRR